MSSQHKGIVTQIIGPVLDIRFAEGELPELRNAITIQHREQVITAEVPMGEMSTYAIDLRSMTQSRGTFTLHFVRYEDCPPAAQEKAIAEAKARNEE